jgi:hypothetical protein
MKSPHEQRPDDQARADTEKFIARYGGRPGPVEKTPTAQKPAAGRSAARSPAKQRVAKR